MPLPAPYEKLIQAFDALPGIGPRAAGRLAQFVLNNDSGAGLAAAISSARDQLTLCSRCFRYALQTPCSACQTATAQADLYVVENTQMQLELEEQGITTLFVLHGLLSPVAGIGPRQLHLPQLRERILNEKPQRLLLCFSPGVEADVTAQFIEDLLLDADVQILRQPLGVRQQEADHGAA